MANNNNNNGAGNNNQNDQWHIGKEIPIAFIFAVFVQTTGGIWWAATLTSKLDNLNAQITELKSDRYTKSESLSDFKFVSQQINELEKRITKIETLKK